MAKLRAGLIGCGGRGRQHASGYQVSEDVELVACVDKNLETAEARAEEFGIRNVYDDYHEMLVQEKPDVVSICLWTGLHLDAVLACVDAGVKLINSEKPMAPTWGDAQQMHKACESAGVLMTFSHQTRYGPAFEKVRDLVKEGAIGDLIRIEGYCSNLFDLGTHRFDRMFFYNDDQPVDWVMGQVNCAEDVTVFAVPVETHGISYVSWKNGVTGLLVTGEPNRLQDRLIGSDGMIENGRDGVRLLRNGHGEWESFELTPVDLPGRETALYILDAISWLNGGEESRTSSRKALQETEIIFATYESARRRARITLPLEIDDSPLLSMLESGEIVVPDYPAKLSAKEEAEGFKLLFNGADLNGWHVIGSEEGWEVQKGLMVCNGEGRGWIRPEATYTDFVLRLDYRISVGGNSGIFLRTSEEGRPAYQGMEIQLFDARRAPITVKSNGAIYDAVAPTVDASRSTGAWNTVEVSCSGSMVKVIINGREVVSCDVSEHPELKDR
ncbi:MAG: DUF1080 domain-containing protein, partial [Candidatus Latescibacteria bacterium]|nr:DUF1080 domain-containing protein [Candidatus Latescibacterota bacterium]